MVSISLVEVELVGNRARYNSTAEILFEAIFESGFE